MIVTNLFALLTSFALFSRQFEETHVLTLLLRVLSVNWKGGWSYSQLCSFFPVTRQHRWRNHRCHDGRRRLPPKSAHWLSRRHRRSVECRRRGECISGDTTTTMMWIAGILALKVLDAYIASVAAFLVFAIPASFQQQRYAPIENDAPHMGRRRLGACGHRHHFGFRTCRQYRHESFCTTIGDRFPVIGAAVWAAHPYHRTNPQSQTGRFCPKQ